MDIVVPLVFVLFLVVVLSLLLRPLLLFLVVLLPLPLSRTSIAIINILIRMRAGCAAFAATSCVRPHRCYSCRARLLELAWYDSVRRVLSCTTSPVTASGQQHILRYPSEGQVRPRGLDPAVVEAMREALNGRSRIKEWASVMAAVH